MSKMLSARLPDTLYAALETYAENRNQTKQQTIITLIESGILPQSNHQPAPRAPETANYARPVHAPGCKCYVCKPPKD
jgi:hypothetical protein